MIYLDLLLGFLEVGLFSFGGAYAAIPLVRDVVLAHGWMDYGLDVYGECRNSERPKHQQ